MKELSAIGHRLSASPKRSRWAVGLALVLASLYLVGCSGTKKPDKLTQELLAKSKEELFQKGKDLIERKK